MKQLVEYLLLVVLGLLLLVQSYLLFKLVRSQRDLEQKVAYLLRKRSPAGTKAPPERRKQPTAQKERGQVS